MPSNQYSPTAEQPYQAYVPPEPLPAAPPIAATQTEPYKFTGAPITGLGAAAGLLDNIFRGYMRGKQEGEAKKVMQLKAKSDNLRNSYDQDARLLMSIAASGASPDSEEYKQAVSAVNGSWGAMTDWQKSHIDPDDDKTKKKPKSKSSQPQQPSDPLTDLRSQDPQVKAKALFQLQQKMGAPVLWQVKQFQTPQAKAQREAQNINAQTGVQAAQNQQTAVNQEAKDQQHTATIQAARAKVDELNKTPQSQWTQAQWTEYNQAQQQIEPRKPGDEVKVSADAIIRKQEADPKYQFTDQDKEVLRGAGYKIDANLKHQVTKTGEIIEWDENGQPNILRGNQSAYEPHGRSGGAGSTDKTYAKWDSYYKQHYPDMDQTERDALVRHKVEGASQQQSGDIAHDAIAEPKKFDNDVLSAAIDRLRNLPQYKDPTLLKKLANGTKEPSLDDMLSNIVGQGDDGYQYHDRGWMDQSEHKPTGGEYAGDISEDGLKNLERDLQTQIRAVMSGSKETALPPAARRAAMGRMQPLFGPAASPRSGTTAASPQPAAQPAASPSSATPAAAPDSGDKPRKYTVYQHGKPHGTVELSAAEAKQLADDPDFKAQGGSIK